MYIYIIYIYIPQFVQHAHHWQHLFVTTACLCCAVVPLIHVECSNHSIEHTCTSKFKEKNRHFKYLPAHELPVAIIHSHHLGLA